jgi:thiol-disulfide isomerase/thioredoxin
MKRILLVALLWACGLSAQAIGLESDFARPAPPLLVPLSAGGHINLADLRGRVVLVNFWASWCPLCLMEMPSLDHMARILGKRRFVLLAVNTDESADWVRGFVRQARISFPVGVDARAGYMHAWGALMVPASFLVDKEGHIRYSLIGPRKWDSPEMLGIISRLMVEEPRACKASC